MLHAPERGAGGHVHHVELDRVIGPRYLVTVHGPMNPAVTREVALRDTAEVLARIRSGRLRPRTSFDISHAIVSTLTRHMERFVEELTTDVWELERRVTDGGYDDPEKFLDEMFRTRHGLLAVRTIAAQTAQIYRRLVGPAARRARGEPAPGRRPGRPVRPHRRRWPARRRTTCRASSSSTGHGPRPR